MRQIDYDKLASELMRSARGRRSQAAWNRRLGAKSNLAYAWESGRRFPTASRALWALERSGIDVKAGMRHFYRTPPDWLESTPLASPDGIARMLQDLRGQTPISDLCERSRRSRFQISRWLSGASEPRLPDFLCVLEAASLRLLDFLAALVDPTKLPSVAPAWSQLQRARRAAYEMPWSHAVLRVLELEQYRALPAHRAGWIGSRLGLSLEEEERCLEMLERTGQIERVGTRYVVAQVLTVDTRQNPAAGRKLKAWWSRVALERIERGEEAEGLFSYNLFSVSEADYQRLRELHLAYFRQLRSIVARSQPAERVVLANVQLFGLDAVPGAET